MNSRLERQEPDYYRPLDLAEISRMCRRARWGYRWEKFQAAAFPWFVLATVVLASLEGWRAYRHFQSWSWLLR